MKNRRISLDKIEKPTCLRVNGKYADEIKDLSIEELYPNLKGKMVGTYNAVV